MHFSGRVAALLLLCYFATPQTGQSEIHSDTSAAYFSGRDILVDLSSYQALNGVPTWKAERPARLCRVPPFKPALELSRRLSRPMRKDLAIKSVAQAKVDQRFKMECRKVILNRNAMLGALA